MEIGAAASTDPRNRAGVWGLVCLALGTIYFIGVALMTPAHPFDDDIAVAQEARRLGEAGGLADAWGVLWSQHNEHRLVVTRVVFWVMQGLPDAVRWKATAMLGGLSLVLLFWLLARQAQRGAAPAAFFVVLASLIFNFASAESSIWPMAAVSNFGVLAMTALMLAMLARGGWLAIAAVAPALIAVGMQGNGMIAPMFGAFFLVCHGRWAQAAAWFAMACGIVVYYISDFVRPIGGPNLADVAKRIGDLVVYVLAFCGAAFAYGGKSLGAVNIVFVSFAATAGAVLVGLTAWGVARGGLWKGRFELWLNLFLIATAGLAAVSRVDYGVQQALAPRYHINSCLLLASTLVWLLTADEAPQAIRRLLQRGSSVLAALGLLYVAATAPILVWMHALHAPAGSPAKSGEWMTPDPRWNLDRAAQSGPPEG